MGTDGLSYSEKLRDPRWQKKRLKIMERDGWRCVACDGSDRELQIHHGYYRKGLDPWDYPDDTLWTVCNRCHKVSQDVLEKTYRHLATFEPTTLLTRVHVYEPADGEGHTSPLEILGPGPNRGGWEPALHVLCPRCRHEYSHATAPIVIDGKDDQKAWSGRGDLTVIHFDGECGHSWELCIGFHKGNNYAFARMAACTDDALSIKNKQGDGP